MVSEPPTAFEPPRLNVKERTPAAYRAMVAFDNASELDASLAELIKLRASIVNGCAFCIDMHARDARALGETEQRLYAVAAWREAPFFDERERAALALTDAVTLITEGHVPREVYDAAAAQFDELELAQLIWAITAINAWNRVAVATRMQPGG